MAASTSWYLHIWLRDKRSGNGKHRACSGGAVEVFKWDMQQSAHSYPFNSIHTCSWQEFQNKWTTSTDTTKYSDDWLKALIWGNILLVLKQRPKTRLLIMKGYYSMYIIFIYILADGLFKISVDPGWIFCSLRPFHTWQGAETSKLPHVPVAHHFAQLR